ncbi:kinase domain-containing protein [Favolaschia claudopus]|uniref:Kinase domain-containing protein n=1 Tax=Favolaschia claudopus TaxID=2862362 RepID=A0AAV9ZYS3_9AGAR
MFLNCNRHAVPHKDRSRKLFSKWPLFYILGPMEQVDTASTSSFLATLSLNAIVFVAAIGLFTVTRPHLKSIYEPRASVHLDSKRAAPLTGSRSLLYWPIAMYNIDCRLVLDKNGADAYFFVRFLRMKARIFFALWIISWAILLPLTSTGSHVGTNSQLDRFTMGNVQPDKLVRYWAHLMCTWIFTFWVFHNVWREMQHFILIRQEYLTSPSRTGSIQAHTFLVTGVPASYSNPAALRELFKDLSGGIHNIWTTSGLELIPNIAHRRMAAITKLEAAVTKFLAMAARENAGSGQLETTTKSQRPSHRVGIFGFWGKKVDSIEWACSEIATCNRLLAQISRDSADDHFKTRPRTAGGGILSWKTCAAFITCNSRISAHMASKALLHHKPYLMSAKYVDVSWKDVVWNNLNQNPYELKLRMLVSYAATTALIIFWTVPAAFIGLASSLPSLAATAPWLSWIDMIPTWVMGFLSGILPPVLLAAVMMLVPLSLRSLAVFEGKPTQSAVELSLMTRFFMFQVVHSFLIITVSSGIVAAYPGLLRAPTSVPTLLAQRLPQASTFFLTFTVLRGLSGAANGLLQIGPLILYHTKLFMLGSTPRSIYAIKYGSRSVQWGTLFPDFTLLAVIGLVYSVISPIINGIACFAFFVFYHLYKYLLVWQFAQPRGSDSGGQFFPRAVGHIFVGLYIQQICMAGLFFLARDERNYPASAPQGVLISVLLVLTILFQHFINDSFGPLHHGLPLTLADSPRETHGSGENWSRENDFHPIIPTPSPIAWFPNDLLGLALMQAKNCHDAGVNCSLQNAEMNAKGRVKVTGPPPDLE